MIILLGIVSVFAGFQFFHMVLEPKEKKSQVIIPVALFFLAESLVEFVVYDWEIAGRLCFNMVMIILLSFAFRARWIERIVYCISYYVFCLLIDLFIAQSFTLAGISIEQSINEGLIIEELAMVVIVQLLYMFFGNKYVKMNKSLGRNIVLLMVPLGSLLLAFFMIYLTEMAGDRINPSIVIYMVILVFVFDFAMFSVYIKIAEQYQIKKENEVYQLEINLYNEHIKEKEHSMQEFRKVKHDFKHQLTYLYNMILNQNIEEAKKYMEDILEMEPLEEVAVAYSDNDVIDALVNYKVATAKQYGIDCRINISIPRELPFANADLCILLGNTLDNAIEANRVEPTENKYIDLKMKYDIHNLVIVIANSYVEDTLKKVNGEYKTRKKDKISHGIGLKSVKNILQKYNGDYSIETENSCFKITMVMYGDCDVKSSNM